MKQIFLIVGITLSLIGCSSKYANTGENLYLKNRNAENLVVPSPLTSSNINHFYDLPSGSNQAEVVITPPPISNS